MNTKIHQLTLLFFYGLFASFGAFLTQALLSLFFPVLSQSLPFLFLLLFVLTEEIFKPLFLCQFFRQYQNTLSPWAIGILFGIGFGTLELFLIFSSLNILSLQAFFPFFIHVITTLFWTFSIKKFFHKNIPAFLLLGSFALITHLMYNSIIFIHNKTV